MLSFLLPGCYKIEEGVVKFAVRNIARYLGHHPRATAAAQPIGVGSSRTGTLTSAPYNLIGP